QRLLVLVVTEGERVARRIHHQRLANDVFQLVANQRDRKVRVGGAHAAALERDDVHPRFAQFLRENAAGPSETHDDDINFLESGGHVVPYERSTMLFGSTSYF